MRTDQEIKKRMNSPVNQGDREILEWVLNDELKIKIADIELKGNWSLHENLLERAGKFEIPTIVVNQNYELLTGFHNLIVAALRGDTEILATLEKKS